jgi:predicted small lipoprotein YifL
LTSASTPVPRSTSVPTSPAVSHAHAHALTHALAPALALTLALAACGDRGPLPLQPTRDSSTAEEPDRLAALLAAEGELRAATDFASLPPFERSSGSNPHRVVAAGGDRVAGITRGSDSVILLDAAGETLATAPAPASPVDLARRGDTLWVVGERSGAIARYTIGDASLTATGEIPVDGALGLRAIAAGDDGALHVAGEVSGAITRIDPRSGAAAELTRCHGPTQLSRVGDALLINCLLDHELQIWEGDTRRQTIHHDGPMWRFAAIADGADLLIAIAGIEDRPLDRSVKGSFGFIDSFAFVYRVPPPSTINSDPLRLAAVNVGEHHLVTPKWIDIAADGAGVRVRASSYGGDRFIAMRWSDRAAAEWGAPAITGLGEIAPGTTDLAWLDGDRAIAANPLRDAWMRWDGNRWTAIAQPPADPRSVESRVGELLFFTKLMAPFGDTEGRKSRFTCEACHFEGYVDGRIHFTGRGDVSATSRSLRGLFNNRPHFSRALDKTTAGMIDNEFRVANKLSGTDYWFSLEPAQFPWLSHLELPAELDPVYLRRALMVFLRDFTNRPNPAVAGRSGYTDLERRGAELFRDRCERCHAARLVVDAPSTRIAFDDWARHIFSDAGAITWAASDYFRTGITPYVHELGARPPQLRRLYKKWPYFTNGSARSLRAVLERVRFKGETLVHEGLASGERFDAAELDALESFLTLL